MDPLGSADLGLLSPVWAGTPAAATTSDAAVVQALLDVESAWVAVQASVAERSAEPEEQENNNNKIIKQINKEKP
jgi:hypothetical protein